MTLTHERLLEVLEYDPVTGLFRWKVRTSNRIKVGDVAGALYENYTRINIDGHRYLAHRLAVFYVTGHWPSEYVDHKRGDKANNRWDNLREATNSQNQANSKLASNNTSGFKGVSWEAKRKVWQAHIKIDRRTKFLGYFKTAEEASAAYEAAAIANFGEFARAA